MINRLLLSSPNNNFFGSGCSRRFFNKYFRKIILKKIFYLVCSQTSKKRFFLTKSQQTRWLIFIGLTSATVHSLFAQIAGQLAPPSIEPAQSPSFQEDLKLPSPPPPVVAPLTEQRAIKIADVTFDGDLLTLKAQAEALRKALTGQSITPEQMIAAARRLEAAFARSGYVLVRVLVPRQSLFDGMTLRIVVINGFIESINTDQVPTPLRKIVTKLLEPLIGRRGIRLEEIERALLLAGDVPGSRLQSAIGAGNLPGSSQLFINSSYQPLSAQIEASNSVSKALGGWSGSVGLTSHSIAGYGEQIYVRAGGYPSGGKNGYFSSDPKNRSLATGITFPIANVGTHLTAEILKATSNTEERHYVPNYRSEFERISLRAKHPFIRSKRLNVNGEIVFDIQSEKLSIADFPWTAERLRILRASGDVAQQFNDGSSLSAKMTLSVGLNAFGARDKSNAFSSKVGLSRQGSNASFKKLDVSFAYSKPLATRLRFDLKGKAQTAFNQAMASAEQFGMTGNSGLSAFSSGTLEGDSGYVARAELISPWQFNLPHGYVLASPYVFGAFGSIKRVAPTAWEAEKMNGGAYGAGIRLTAIDKQMLRNTQFAIESSRQIRRDGQPTQSRLTLLGSLVF